MFKLSPGVFLTLCTPPMVQFWRGVSGNYWRIDCVVWQTFFPRKSGEPPNQTEEIVFNFYIPNGVFNFCPAMSGVRVYPEINRVGVRANLKTRQEGC